MLQWKKNDIDLYDRQYSSESILQAITMTVWDITFYNKQQWGHQPLSNVLSGKFVSSLQAWNQNTRKPGGGLKKKKKLRAKILGNLAYVKICQISKESLSQPVSCTSGKKYIYIYISESRPKQGKIYVTECSLVWGYTDILKKGWRWGA